MQPLDLLHEVEYNVFMALPDDTAETLPEELSDKPVGMPRWDDPAWPRAQYYTTAEAAERLGVTPRRVRQLIDEGSLRSTMYGRDHLITRNSITGLLKIRGVA